MARIFLTKQGARKSTGGKAPRKALGRGPPGPRRAASAYRRPTSAWHPALIAAVNDGGWERIFGALAAKEEWEGQHVCYKVGRKGQHRHPDSVQGAGQGLVTVPFPLSRLFGLLPYAAYRGHEEVVAAFCAAGFDPEGTAQVRVAGD